MFDQSILNSGVIPLDLFTKKIKKIMYILFSFFLDTILFSL